MPIFNPLIDSDALRDRIRQHAGLVVVCYCADWCDSCKSYFGPFSELAERFPQHVFVWVDIEENPEYLGDDDVENFPTIAIQDQQRNLFFGPLLPFISHLEKLIDRVEGGPAMGDGPPLVREVAAQA